MSKQTKPNIVFSHDIRALFVEPELSGAIDPHARQSRERSRLEPSTDSVVFVVDDDAVREGLQNLRPQSLQPQLQLAKQKGTSHAYHHYF